MKDRAETSITKSLFFFPCLGRSQFQTITMHRQLAARMFMSEANQQSASGEHSLLIGESGFQKSGYIREGIQAYRKSVRTASVTTLLREAED